MYCSGGDKGAWLEHADQYRGLKYCYTRKADAPGATIHAEPSPDYFQYADLGGKGMMPVGYGYRSVDFILRNILRVESKSAGLPDTEALARRQELLREIDAAGIMATPANSRYNELVLEAGRLSILNGGREVVIDYGEMAGVRLEEGSR